MGFLDDLKKATAIGLTHAQHYERAYEKGVLLGPARFRDAVVLFDEAARRAAEAGDHALQARAAANARLYGFLLSGACADLVELAKVLPYLGEIERIGSRTEVMAAGALLFEVEARIAEYEVPQSNAADHATLAAAHHHAATRFERFVGQQLITYRYQHADSHIETAASRFFLHQGLTSWHHAMHTVMASPESAAEHMGKALGAFRQCNDATWSADALAWLSNCRLRRTCWMCHREFQGNAIHFRTYPADISAYHVSVVAELGQDASMLDAHRGLLVLCAPCGSAFEKQADLYAQRRTAELRAHLEGQIAALAATVQQLSIRLEGIR